MNIFFVRFPGFKRKALTLSYDDGVAQDKRMIRVLDSYGMKCTFNLNGCKLMGQTDAPGMNIKRPAVSRQEAPEVYKNHEVAVHSLFHPWLDELPAGNAAWELVHDREVLEEVFGRIIRGMAYPMGGTQSDALVAALKSCGIQYARTTKQSLDFELPKDWLRLQPTAYHGNPQLMELTQKFVELKPQWMSKLFYVWGHSYEFDEKYDWNLLENFCRAASGKEDIWYATNGEIVSYLTAADQLVTSINGTVVMNPTATPLFLENYYSGEKVLLEPGKSCLMSRETAEQSGSFCLPKGGSRSSLPGLSRSCGSFCQ